MNTIVKTTSKGQVTLPAKWRKNFDTNRYLIKENGNELIITPLEVEALETEQWEVIFDAKRDNKGKGVPIDDFVKILRKTL
jgi:bifunctional DNA-binding transcriptional regulator/antitoxin component of YhaV-PrlF toxin-antitoxin module